MSVTYEGRKASLKRIIIASLTKAGANEKDAEKAATLLRERVTNDFTDMAPLHSQTALTAKLEELALEKAQKGSAAGILRRARKTDGIDKSEMETIVVKGKALEAVEIIARGLGKYDSWASNPKQMGPEGQWPFRLDSKGYWRKLGLRDDVVDYVAGDGLQGETVEVWSEGGLLRTDDPRVPGDEGYEKEVPHGDGDTISVMILLDGAKSVEETFGDPIDETLLEQCKADNVTPTRVMTYLRAEKSLGIFQALEAMQDPSTYKGFKVLPQRRKILKDAAKWKLPFVGETPVSETPIISGGGGFAEPGGGGSDSRDDGESENFDIEDVYYTIEQVKVRPHGLQGQVVTFQPEHFMGAMANMPFGPVGSRIYRILNITGNMPHQLEAWSSTLVGITDLRAMGERMRIGISNVTSRQEGLGLEKQKVSTIVRKCSDGGALFATYAHHMYLHCNCNLGLTANLMAEALKAVLEDARLSPSSIPGGLLQRAR